MNVDKKFFVFDTETQKGKSFLLCVKNKEKNFVYETKTKKDVIKFFENCVEKTYGNIGFAFNMDYDVLALFRFFDKNFFTKIYVYRTVIYEGLEFTYIPKKFLQIKKGNKVVTIFELYQFYNTTLDNAGKKFLGIEKIKIKNTFDIKNLKKHFKGKDKQKIINYCLQDCKITLDLTLKLDTMFINYLGLNVNKYYSCGFLAKKYATKRGINISSIQDDKINDFVKKSYFGGRIEFIQKGYFKNCYQYDINSAYPHQIANLFQIVDLQFNPKINPYCKYFFVDCEIDLPENILNPIPFRTDKNLLIYPSGKFNTVLDCFTFNEVKPYIKKINNVLNIYTTDNKPFFEMVTTLYNKRLKTKNADENYIIKIILNSLYGKFAQQKSDYVSIDEINALLETDEHLQSGGRGILQTDFGFFKRIKKFDKNANLIYAALITAQTRLKLYRTAKVLGLNNVIGFMTDCIFSTKPLPKNLISSNKKLGEFGFKEKSYLYVMGSGIYQSESGTKIRGYATNKNLIELAKNNGEKNQLFLNSTEKKGVGKLVIQGVDLSDLNNILEVEKILKLNFDTKRMWEKDFKNFSESLQNTVKSTSLKL